MVNYKTVKKPVKKIKTKTIRMEKGNKYPGYGSEIGKKNWR